MKSVIQRFQDWLTGKAEVDPVVVSEPEKIPASVFSDCFMAEYNTASSGNCACWAVVSLTRICVKDEGVRWYCWTCEDAIELMKRLDPIEKERIASIKVPVVPEVDNVG